MSDQPEPIEALRARPGEFILVAERVSLGDRIRTRDALYEVTSEATKWGISWVADLRVLEGIRAGAIVHNAMLHTGKRVE